MVAPAHLSLTWSGTLGDPLAPPEIWSFGLNASDTGFNTEAALLALTDALQLAWVDEVGPVVGQEVRLTRVRAAAVGADGLVRRDPAGAYIQKDNVTRAGGTAAQTGMNFAVSLAISTVTAFPGATGRGRFYLPLPAFGSMSNGVLQVAQRDNILTRMRAFLVRVNAALTNQGHGPVVIASGGSIVKGIPPGLRPVTAVRVGLVPDTMRSRRNALAENYATLVL